MGKASDPAAWSGEADFTFDGQPYRITFDNMALLEAEGAVGITLMKWLPDFYATLQNGGVPMLKQQAALIYGGLKVNHPEITFKQAVKMTMASDPGLREAIKRALVAIELPDDALADVGNEPLPPANRKARRAAAKKK